MDSLFRLEFEVRDYEWDMQGIVNNAVYQNYLEHTRHQFLQSRGLDFATLTAQGLDLVLVRAELDCRSSLRSGDRFVVDLRHEPLGRVRQAFLQDIRKDDGTHVLSSRMVWTVVDRKRGRPCMPADLLEKISPNRP